MNKNNTLNRTTEVVVHAACRLIRDGAFASHLKPGVVLRVKRISPFKVIVSWYAPSGEGHDFLDVFLEENSDEYYIVDRAWSRLSYWWHRIRMGELLYLRSLSSSDHLSRELKLLKTRDVLM